MGAKVGKPTTYSSVTFSQSYRLLGELPYIREVQNRFEKGEQSLLALFLLPESFPRRNFHRVRFYSLQETEHYEPCIALSVVEDYKMLIIVLKSGFGAYDWASLYKKSLPEVNQELEWMKISRSYVIDHWEPNGCI